MHDLIDNHRVELMDLCRNHRVKTLELFGSAADGSFDPATSDLDFLVDFESMPPVEHGDAYFEMWFGLAKLFGRKVDLVETAGIKNPYFLKTVDANRRVVYAN